MTKSEARKTYRKVYYLANKEKFIEYNKERARKRGVKTREEKEFTKNNYKSHSVMTGIRFDI
jgi:hypothetical protein